MEHGSISLEELIVESTSASDLEKDPSALKRLFRRLRLSQQLIERHSHFSEQSYCRSLVCRTTRIDLLILGWQPGQFSSIHDHCESLNCTRVLSGRAKDTAPAAAGRVRERIRLGSKWTIH